MTQVMTFGTRKCVSHVEVSHFKCLEEILTQRIWNLANCHTVSKRSVFLGFPVVTNPLLAQVVQLVMFLLSSPAGQWFSLAVT